MGRGKLKGNHGRRYMALQGPESAGHEGLLFFVVGNRSCNYQLQDLMYIITCISWTFQTHLNWQSSPYNVSFRGCEQARAA